MSQCKVRILLDGLFIHGQSVFELALAEIVAAAQEEIIGLGIYGGLARNDFFFLRGKGDFEGFGDA